MAIFGQWAQTGPHRSGLVFLDWGLLVVVIVIVVVVIVVVVCNGDIGHHASKCSR